MNALSLDVHGPPGNCIGAKYGFRPGLQGELSTPRLFFFVGHMNCPMTARQQIALLARLTQSQNPDPPLKPNLPFVNRIRNNPSVRFFSPDLRPLPYLDNHCFGPVFGPLSSLSDLSNCRLCLPCGLASFFLLCFLS